jgi:DNA-binding NarL/FixJ family response regulator
VTEYAKAGSEPLSTMAKARRSNSASPSTQRRIKVFIVDDHPIVRHGLSQVIGQESEFEVCGEAAEASTAFRQIEETKPDLVIVDIMLRDASGLELIKQVKACNDQVKMLVTSMHDETLYAERALRAGAMGYLKKEEAVTKVIEAIRQVLKGKIYLSAAMADHFLHRALRGGDEPERSPIERLSDRELEVFELIGRGLTTRQIAERLHLSTKTIETHREHIKTKLQLKNNNELVRQAVLRLIEEEPGSGATMAPNAPAPAPTVPPVPSA